MKINGERMSPQQFANCIGALSKCDVSRHTHLRVHNGVEFLNLTIGADCFDICSSYKNNNWSMVIHDKNEPGLVYFKDRKFKAYHYANHEAFELAKLAHGGIPCKVCRIYHRNFDICKLCKLGQ